MSDREDRTRDRYRGIVRDHLEELERLVDAFEPGLAQVESSAREIVEALLGSDPYGFAAVSRGARLVADAGAETFLPRLTGFTDLLREVVDGGAGEGSLSQGWLAHAAGPFPRGGEEVVEELRSEKSLTSAWRKAAVALELDEEGVAERVAGRLGAPLADLSATSRQAVRLVPPSLMEAGPTLPLREDGLRLVAAAANPTDLRLIAAVERITGRTAVLEVAPPHALRSAVLRVLPARDARAGEEEASPYEPPPVGTRGTALVVDDDAGERHMVRRVLEEEGFAVEEAADGDDALRRLEERSDLSVLVVDLQMPTMDGRELVSRVRQGGSEIPLLVLTGAEGRDVEAELIEGGADDYVRKPLDPRVFVARVSALLRRRGR